MLAEASAAEAEVVVVANATYLVASGRIPGTSSRDLDKCTRSEYSRIGGNQHMQVFFTSRM